jgi:hypothetical protein
MYWTIKNRAYANITYLVLSAKDMGIILPEIYTSKDLIRMQKVVINRSWKKNRAYLLEPSNTCQTCKCATKLVSVKNSKISQAERQLCSSQKRKWRKAWDQEKEGKKSKESRLGRKKSEIKLYNYATEN